MEAKEMTWFGAKVNYIRFKALLIRSTHHRGKESYL